MEEIKNIKQVLGIKESATEKTLQSIDSTLKRIEKILLKDSMQSFDADRSKKTIKGITISLPEIARKVDEHLGNESVSRRQR